MPAPHSVMLSEIRVTIEAFGIALLSKHLTNGDMGCLRTSNNHTPYSALLTNTAACRQAVESIRRQNESISTALQVVDSFYSQAQAWDDRINAFLSNMDANQSPDEALILFRYDNNFASRFADQPVHGYTPFMWACCMGHHDVVKEMLPVAQLHQALFDDGQTALLMAIESGHTEIAKELIVNGADITQGRTDGYTPLMAAAEFGYNNLVCSILWQAQWCDMESPDVTEYVNRSGGGGGDIHWSQTALMWAISGHQLYTAQLIAESAYCESRTIAECGYNALIAAASFYDEGEEDLTLFSTILNDTPNLEEQATTTSTAILFDRPYYMLGYTALLSACEKGSTQKVQMLLERGANPNHGLGELTFFSYEYTPLMAAHGHYEITLLLLKAGADVRREFKLRDGEIVRALHFAVGADGHQLIDLAERLQAPIPRPLAPLPRSRCSSIGNDSDDDMPALVSIY